MPRKEKVKHCIHKSIVSKESNDRSIGTLPRELDTLKRLKDEQYENWNTYNGSPRKPRAK